MKNCFYALLSIIFLLPTKSFADENYSNWLFVDIKCMPELSRISIHPFFANIDKAYDDFRKQESDVLKKHNLIAIYDFNDPQKKFRCQMKEGEYEFLLNPKFTALNFSSPPGAWKCRGDLTFILDALLNDQKIIENLNFKKNCNVGDEIEKLEFDTKNGEFTTLAIIDSKSNALYKKIKKKTANYIIDKKPFLTKFNPY